jgi:hypothetical protein
MVHIDSDKTLMDKMKPLIAQLKLCDNKQTESEAKISLLETRATSTAQAKCAAVHRTVSSLLEISTAPTGNFADFEHRVQKEVDHAKSEKDVCDKNADDLFEDTNAATSKLEDETKAQATTVLTETDASLLKSLTELVAKETSRIDDLQKSCCEACTEDVRFIFYIFLLFSSCFFFIKIILPFFFSFSGLLFSYSHSCLNEQHWTNFLFHFHCFFLVSSSFLCFFFCF